MTQDRPSQFIVRTAVSISDFESIFLMLHDHIGGISLKIAASYLDTTAQELQTVYTKDGSGVLIGMAGEVACGMMAYKAFGPWCAQLNYFYVKPDCRGAGLGSRLMAAVLEQSRADGYYSAILSTLPQLTAARELYLRFGFSRIPAAYPDLPDAEYYLRTL